MRFSAARRLFGESEVLMASAAFKKAGWSVTYAAALSYNLEYRRTCEESLLLA